MHHASVITARSAPVQRGFYARIFGWVLATDEQLNCAFGETPDGPIGGIGQSTEGGRHPPGIVAYGPVPDLDAALALATVCRGTCLVAPWTLPGQGRMAVVANPEGNRVGIWRQAEDGK